MTDFEIVLMGRRLGKKSGEKSKKCYPEKRQRIDSAL